MENIEQYLNRDIYYVEQDSKGKKQVNIQRYYYQGDEELTCVEFTWIRLPIDKITLGRVMTEEDGCKQYTSYTNEEYIETDLQDATPLSILEVTEETPCGKYIDF